MICIAKGTIPPNAKTLLLIPRSFLMHTAEEPFRICYQDFPEALLLVGTFLLVPKLRCCGRGISGTRKRVDAFIYGASVRVQTPSHLHIFQHTLAGPRVRRPACALLALCLRSACALRAPGQAGAHIRTNTNPYICSSDRRRLDLGSFHSEYLQYLSVRGGWEGFLLPVTIP